MSISFVSMLSNLFSPILITFEFWYDNFILFVSKLLRKRTYYIVDYEHSVGYLKYVDHLKDFLSLYKVSRHENVNFTKGISQRVVDYLYESKDHVFFQ